MKSIIKNLQQQKNQELQVERNKLAEAEKKAKDDVNYQVAKALQVKKEYENVLRNEQRKYTKLLEQAKKQSSETIKRLEDTCAKQISELKKEHKRFENRVVRAFNDRENKVKREAKDKISRIQEEYKNSQGKDDKTKDAMRIEIQRLKTLLNDLNTQRIQTLKEGEGQNNNKLNSLQQKLEPV